MNRFKEKLSNRKWLDFAIFMLIISVFSYFFACGGGNQNARFNPVYSFVEPGTNDFLTFRMNRFILNPKLNNTCDWSYYEGNYYSNKAPGSIFIGTAVYLPLFWLEELLGIPWNYPYVEILNAYIINFFVSVLIVGLGILFFYKLLLIKEFPIRKALFLSLILAFSTMIFPYSTELWGHPTAMAFIIFALYNMEKGNNKNIALAGFFAGFATLTDYLALFITFALGVFIIINNRKKLFWYVIGGVLPMLLMLAYHYFCFGNIFNTPTTFTNPIFLQKNAFLGLFSTISWKVFMKLLIGLERGLLPVMPILVFSFIGFYFYLKAQKKDLIYAMFSITTLFLILFVNASFIYWFGGNSACARYQIIAMPFWVLLIGGIPNKRSWNIPLIIVSLFSAFNMLCITCVCVQTYGDDTNPVYGTIYPHFFKGEFNIFNYPIRLQRFHEQWSSFANATSWNIGNLLGLKAWFSLIPLLIIVIVFTFIIRKLLLKIDQEEPNMCEVKKL